MGWDLDRMRAAVRVRTDRAGRSVRSLSSRSLQRGLSLVEPGRTLVMTEYPIDPQRRWGWEHPANPWIEEIFDRALPDVARLAGRLEELAEWCATIPATSSGETLLAWDNPYWNSIDAVMQVHALRERRCATYLEVGSGFSTMFARKAIEDFGLPTRIISVDPHPRAEIDELCDEVVRARFEDVATDVLGRLAPGDVFVFDGSHLATLGSDASVLFGGTLALVPPGVLLGIDDVFLPWDYPPTWEGRWYGEQYLVAAWLLGGARGWEVRLPAWHTTRVAGRADLFDRLWPTIEPPHGRHGTALWVERSH